MKKIGVLTSGGDAPGMNAAIRAVVRTGIFKGMEVIGIEKGYEGLLSGLFRQMNAHSVSGIIDDGGTILRTARSMEFKTPEGQAKAAKQIEDTGIDGLVVIGGDGSYRGALAIHETCGVKVIGIPGTIDNDINGTEYTIGFDTAVNTALESIDKIRDTAASHDRIFVVEVMGRLNGSIALDVAIAGGAEAVLIPEVKHDMIKLCRNIEAWRNRGKMSCIIIVAEGAAKGADIAATITQVTGIETRLSVLGHVQRGGSPSAKDRSLATHFGNYAVDLLAQGKTNLMVGMLGGRIHASPLEDVTAGGRPVDPNVLNVVDVMAT